MIQADEANISPLSELPYKNCPISSPAPANKGTTIALINNANIILVRMRVSMCFVSSFATAIEMSGTSAVESAPISADGTNSSGIVMPTATPKRLIACEDEYPMLISLAGIINATSGCAKLPPTLTPVIGVERRKSCLKSFGLDSLPP